MLAIIFYSAAAFILLFFLGYGVTVIATPKPLLDYRLWLMPWFGLIFLTIVLTVFSLLGLTIFIIAPYLLIFLIVLNGWVFIKMKRIPLSFSREDLVILVLVMFVMVFTLSVLIIKAKFLTTISMGSNDVHAYAVTPDYLLNHSISESLRVSAPHAADGLLRFGYRWGPSLITAFFLYFFRLAGYQFVSIFQPVLFALTLPLIYVVFRMLSPLNKALEGFRGASSKKSLLGLVFIILGVGLNVNILYILYHNFFGQILFGGFQLILFILCLIYFDSPEFKSRRVSVFDILVASTLTAIVFSYNEGLVVIIPVFFIVFLRSILHRKDKKTWMFSWLKLCAVLVLLSSYSLAHFVYFNLFYRTGDISAPIGWQQFRAYMPFANPFEMLGFYSIHSFPPLPTIAILLVSGFTLAFIIRGYVVSVSKLLLSSFLRVYGLFLLWFGFIQPNYFVYNRLVTLALPFLVLLFGIGFVSLFSKKRVWGAVLFIIFLLVILFNALKLNARYLRESIVVGKQFISLKNLASLPLATEPIYAENMLDTSLPLWNQVWADYFLYPKKNLIYSVGQFDKKNIPNNALALIAKQPLYYSPLSVDMKSVVWENEYYRLGRVCPEDECIPLNNINNSISARKGWGTQEAGHRWTTSKTASVQFTFRKGKARYLIMEALTLGQPQELEVYIDDELIARQNISTKWEKYKFELPELLFEGPHTLNFNVSHLYKPSEILKNGDTRELGIDVKSITLEK